MHLRVRIYIAVTCVAAVLSWTAAYVLLPRGGEESSYLVFLSLMALVAEAVAILLPSGGALNSIASVPFQAAGLIAPDWTSICAAAIVSAAAQLMRRKGWTKGIFNVAQTVLAMSAAVGIYRTLGGQSFLNFNGAEFSTTTLVAGLPALVFIAAFFLMNTLAVSGVIALNDGRRVAEVWRHNHRSTLVYEISSGPFVIFFAWMTVVAGPFGAVLLSLPALGLRQLYKTKLELERSHQEMLELMVKAIEARDPYTSGHSRRVQHYSMVIARAIGLSDREVERIGVAALLHDVGKIHEKYAPLLRKPDRLTEEEWRTMEQHPVDGAALVATASQLRDVVLPVRHHHERWDGRGYPDGLKGEQIPLASRIIIFADTIDAMTTARPYRAALGEEDVRSEIVACRSKQFDPSICDELLTSPLWSLLFAAPRPTVQAPASTVRLSVNAVVKVSSR